VPDDELARAIIAAAGGALAVTSANRSGAAPAVEAREVNRLGLAQPLLIVDGGQAPGGVPSTIVAVTTEALEVLREGAIPASAIAAAVADVDPVASAEVRARYDHHKMQEHERSDARETTS
jgi:tRNA A37 threonylcarbamoyladenosine synthetase subunit TsaC/SUA5/YrdC